MATLTRLVLVVAMVAGLSTAAHATVIDFFTSADGNTPDTTSGSIANAVGSGTALFEWTDYSATGTGVIDTFVQVQGPANGGFEAGYNTTVNPVLQNGSSAEHNHELLIGQVPIVNIGGVDYREFLCDANEPGGGGKEFVSMNDVQIFLSNTANQSVTTLDANGHVQLANSVLIYAFSANDRVEMDASLNAGSGHGDVFMYIPDSLFVDGYQYLYLYSEFGRPNLAHAGFEEWSVRLAGDTSVVPEPGTMSLLGLGLAGMVARRLRKRS